MPGKPVAPMSLAAAFKPAFPTRSSPAPPAATPASPLTAPDSATRSSRRGYTAGEAKRRRTLVIIGGVLAVVVVGLWLMRPWQDSTPPGPSTATLLLTTNVVRIQESYFAYASGFQPDEPIELSWTGPTNGTMGDAAAADGTGALRRGPIVERDPPGDYKIVAHGQRSGWTATAQLQVRPER